ncbi:MAG: bifunctional glycosyltransferase family 2/GtrA family protein [Eubacteriales bacterium]|nr:bifunctional glycosyltransferase family 2/GtrA family protein [Eubacteriales bacterium]
MKTALIIPAYKPDMKLIALLEQFRQNPDFLPVVVDDGSGPEFERVFAALPEGATLLRHSENRGKGAALKTAIRHVLENMPQCERAVTADADGQHKYEDILRVTEKSQENPENLVLGSRRFDGNVPFKSRWGNAITRQVFTIACGAKVYDTQTGLRAFGRDAMAKFLSVPGERYEYEINMLLWAARNGMKIDEVTIKTVYIDDNASSHFHPVRDSMKIYACLLKFAGSSLLSFGIDFVMLLLLKLITRGLGEELSLLVSVVGARVISASINFLVNRSLVFQGNESVVASAAKYAGLAIAILCANYYLIRLLTIPLNWPLIPSKLLVEVVLFTVSFLVQGRFVYRKRRA